MRIQIPRIVPATTGNMIARSMLMKKERKVQTMKISMMMKMLMVLKRSQGTRKDLLEWVMLVKVTMRERMMLVEEREASTISITLLLSSIRSIIHQTVLVT